MVCIRLAIVQAIIIFLTEARTRMNSVSNIQTGAYPFLCEKESMQSRAQILSKRETDRKDILAVDCTAGSHRRP
jgi:hypothetical protein